MRLLNHHSAGKKSLSISKITARFGAGGLNQFFTPMIFEKYSWLKNKYLLFQKKVSKSDGMATTLAFLFFAGLNAAMYFTVANVSSTDDQWFYTKMAILFRAHGWSPIVHFQGAYFTDLVQSHYSYAFGLYHFFLIPFTFFPDKILGMKFSGLIIASLVPTLTYWTLKKFGFKYSFFWVVSFFYALASFDFTFRLFLNRPFVLIDALVLVEIYLISQKKWWAFLAVSLINTWWHPATFWLPLFLAGSFEVARLLHLKKLEYKNILAGAIGSLGAFLLFPFHAHTFLSPTNPFYFIKTLLSYIYGINNSQGIIEGSENARGTVFGLFDGGQIFFFFLILYMVLCVVLYVYRKSNDDVDIDQDEYFAILRDYVFLIIIAFLLGYVFSQRFEDLLVPLVFLGSLIAVRLFTQKGFLRINDASVKNTLVFTFLVFIFVAVGNRVLDFRKNVGNDQNYLGYEKAAGWLKSNTAKNEIVFNTDFGQFNRLFFYDDWNRYIVGIEPKNMYEYSPALYWAWNNITLYGILDKDGNGKETAQNMLQGKNDDETAKIMLANAKAIAPVIKNDFQSRYVFFDSDTFLRKELEKDSADYVLVYNNKEDGVYIYKIKIEE